MLVGNHSGGVALDGAMVLASHVPRDGPAAARAGHGREVHQHAPLRLAVDEPHAASSPACPSTPSACSRTSACSWSSPRARAAPPSSTRSATRWCSFGTGFMRLAHEDEDADRARSPSSAAARRSRRSSNAYTLGQAARRAVHPGHAVPRRRCRCPCELEIHYGEPMIFEGTGTEDDEVIDGYVEQVKERIAELIDDGRRASTAQAARRRRMKVLIPGIAGRLARMRRRRGSLDAGPRGHRHRSRARGPTRPTGIEVHEVDIRKRAAEDVFRKRAPRRRHPHGDGHAPRRAQSEERYRINLGGTRAVFDHCRALRRRARRSSSAATPTTAPPPTRRSTTPRTSRRWRSTTFPELADLVAADLYAGTALWRFPSSTTAVLRIVLHARRRPGTARSPRSSAARACRWCSASIRSSSSCTSDDVGAAPSSLALEKRLRGVFNVAGPQPVPLSRRSSARRGARRSRCPRRSSRAARPLRPAQAPAGRAHAHQVPGGRRRRGVPRGHGLHARTSTRSRRWGPSRGVPAPGGCSRPEARMYRCRFPRLTESGHGRRLTPV